MNQFFYGLKARPLSPGTIPTGIEFQHISLEKLSMNPVYGEPRSRMRDARDIRHGMIVTTTKISSEDIYSFELVDLNPVLPVAIYISDITVIDPDTGLDVDVSIYKNTTTGGMFGVDTSYIVHNDSGDGLIVKDFIDGKDILLSDGE